MNYLLEKNELNSLILFNGLIGDRLQRKSITDQLKVWDEVIFNNLLIKQPELKKEYDFFREEFENNSFKSTFFSELFEKKIELKSAIHFLFKNSYEYNGEPENRFKLFINLAAKSPEFPNILHQAVKENYGTDHNLFEAYFKIIKTSSVAPQDEVLQNIKKYKTDSILKNEKKKILAYLNFNKDKDLYGFIMDDMNELLSNSPLLTDYWESKLKLFPLDIRQDFICRKVDSNPFICGEEIIYKITLDREWIISKFKLTPTVAGDFIIYFYKGLSESLSKKFGSSDANFLGNGIRINCISPEILKEVKSFCNKLMPEIYLLFQNFDFKPNNVKGEIVVEEIITKFAFADSLSDSLRSKNEFKPKMKI